MGRERNPLKKKSVHNSHHPKPFPHNCSTLCKARFLHKAEILTSSIVVAINRDAATIGRWFLVYALAS